MIPGIHVLTSAGGQRFSFDPGSLSLELLATGGPGEYRRWEILHRPADLADWLTRTRLAAAAPLTAGDVLVRPAELARIRLLRDTLWAVAPALAHGERPDAADVEVVNAAAGEPPRLRVDPADLARRWVTPVTGGQVLGAFARDALHVIGTPALRGRVRECADDRCRLIFLDTSRPGNRRWCSMERCGNRNKARIHRNRHTTQPTVT
ncbi:CGNR zinc finger domain-containing protein [Dactylosporangium aurantiacum]|uniref:CGNR zinc finger domain-containing protein n=1 Tax=Dactylosporangium aurantiacum TaxID=35754 RepID=A0A9Q9IR63_9ACTN|nr:CGNR zinc finger domain-containing protein [Dactylosporangium aurantiacum]MDG6102994.1 CGNR zinc finger domain-containing protein [Dactylosporangium aurantiacum]UWZ57508.1 CGNR zinc finger domain-containing protein [Dactylosporangium aurantiacum]